MKRLKAFVALSVGLFLLMGCEAPVKIGCQDVSLRTDCVNMDAPPLPAPKYGDKPAFESKNLERSYLGAPPQIPHSVVDMAITPDANMCLDCHFPGGDPIPALPDSHKTIPKIVIDVAQKPQVTKVVGHELTEEYDRARYFCVQCHVPQALNLKPLVANQFK